MENMNLSSREEMEEGMRRLKNDELIEEFIGYMSSIKNQKNLINKWRYLKHLNREIEHKIYGKELDIISISVRGLSDEVLQKEIEEMENNFFNTLKERNIMEEAEKRLKYENSK